MESMKLGEVFQGYRMTGGAYGDPVPIASTQELSEFILANVEQYEELRVVDKNDELVFHVFDQELLHPVPERGAGKRNRWDRVQKKFIEQ